jgi:hypothetical protein
MDQIESQTLHSKILRPYEDRAEYAWEQYRLAKQFGKKDEQKDTKKAWDIAVDVLVAVDEALADYRGEVRKAGN